MSRLCFVAIRLLNCSKDKEIIETQPSSSAARERALHAAEELFGAHGYNAVSLKDIASLLGIRHASLYSHFPGGKEEMYVAVMQRALHRHYEYLSQIGQTVSPPLRQQFRAVVDWLLTQPPLHMMRMMQSDMHVITPDGAKVVSDATYEALFVPVEQLIEAAYQRGEVRFVNTGMVAGLLLTAVETLRSLRTMPGYEEDEAERMRSLNAQAYDVIDILLDGILRH